MTIEMTTLDYRNDKAWLKQRQGMTTSKARLDYINGKARL